MGTLSLPSTQSCEVPSCCRIDEKKAVNYTDPVACISEMASEEERSFVDPELL